MGLADDAIWWHLYPLGFCGAPIRDPDIVAPAAPRLARLSAWLDYAVELGVSGLALGPVFASTSHGYDTMDHYRIDPRLGAEGDLAALVDAAHARGLAVLLDGVFNHVGADHPLLRRALTEGPEGEYAGWFRLDWARANGGPPAYADFEGHHGLALLNHAEPAVVDYVVDVMTHWLDRGIDGWRLDAAYAIPPATWARIITRVRARHPGALLVGEVIHGDYAGVVAGGGMDAVTQYELWKAAWSSLVDRNFFELAWALDRHNGFLDAFAPLTFVGNHDVTRIAQRVGDDGAVAALAVLCTVGGMPSIYYGDEQAFRGEKTDRLGGDDAVRPAYPERPGELAPWGWWMYRRHQELLALRRRHRWLVRARTTVRELTNERIRYDACEPDGAGRLSVELDVTGGPRVRVWAGDVLEFAHG